MGNRKADRLIVSLGSHLLTSTKFVLKKPVLLLFLVFFYSSFICFSQKPIKAINTPPSVARLKPLKIGDRVPDLEIKNVLNIPSGKTKLSDYKGKLLIIDFWETYCSNCIAALPKIQELEKKFNGQVKVITVTKYDSKENTIKRLQNYKKTKDLKLPVVINDDKLFKIFPFELVSHVVWIGSDGNVKAITGTDYITEGNINEALSNGVLNWAVKKDVAGFDYNAPFLSFGQFDKTGPSRFLYYSAFTGHINGVDAKSGMFVDTIMATKTLNYYNYNLLSICQGAAEGVLGSPNSKDIVFMVKDKSRYIRDNEYISTWAVKNQYSYSITIPISTSEKEKREAIKSDLARWLEMTLHVSSKKEKRMVRCLVLTRVKKEDSLLNSKGGERTLLNEGTKIKQNINSPFGNIIWYLNQEMSDLPWVYDETGVPTGMLVDMEFKASSFHDIRELRMEFQRYGFDLIETQRERDMYVITESNFQQ